MENPEPNTTPEVGAEASAQPIDGEQVAAVQPQEPAPNDAPSEDDTAEWLSKKGYDPNDPELAAKLARSYREAEKLAMSKAQEASELRKSLTPQQSAEQQTFADPNLAALSDFAQEYKRDKQLTSFKESHHDWQQHEPTMVNLLYENVATPYGEYSRNQLVNMGILSLNDVYAIAKGSAPVNTESIKTEAKQEVLQTLANTQRAGGATPHASSATPTSARVTKENVDAWWDGLGSAGRQDPANRALLDSVLGS